MELEIKLGDKVKLVKPSPRTIKYYSSLSVEDEGTVVQVTNAYEALLSWFAKLICGYYIVTDWTEQLVYGIEWRNLITNGHDCQGNCKKGHGSYVEAYEIEKI